MIAVVVVVFSFISSLVAVQANLVASTARDSYSFASFGEKPPKGLSSSAFFLYKLHEIGERRGTRVAGMVKSPFGFPFSLPSKTISFHTKSFLEKKSVDFAKKAGFSLHPEYLTVDVTLDSRELSKLKKVVNPKDKNHMVDGYGQTIGNIWRLGARKVVQHKHMVGVDIPYGSLKKLAALPGVAVVRPTQKRRPLPSSNSFFRDSSKMRKSNSLLRDSLKNKVGTVTSEGVEALNVVDSSASSSSTECLGILSDSYDTSRKADALRASGDLPETVKVLRDFEEGTDEGRGMMELAFDIAPSASVMVFSSVGQSQAQFARAILSVGVDDAATRCTTVVDDILFFAEPMFQDGIVAQAAEGVYKVDGLFFSAAGNSGSAGLFEAFNPIGTPTGPRQHQFQQTGEQFLPIDIPAGETVILAVLQWSQPSLSANGIRGALSDLDIGLFDNTGAVVASSVDNNIGSDPVEILSFLATLDAPETFKLVIRSAPTTNADLLPEALGLVIFSGPSSGLVGPTSYGHANADSVVSVGAAFFGDTPAFGTTPPVLQTFSSSGGFPIFFDTLGFPFPAPVLRQNPSVVGPDGTNTVSFPQSSLVPLEISDFDGDGNPNFFGTSASAPQVAGVGFLLRSYISSKCNGKKKENSAKLCQGKLSKKIRQALEESSLDMDDPTTEGFDEGFDFASGFGLVDATKALDALTSKFEEGTNETLNQFSCSPNSQFRTSLEKDQLQAMFMMKRGDGLLKTFFLPKVVSANLKGSSEVPIASLFPLRNPTSASTMTYKVRLYSSPNIVFTGEGESMASADTPGFHLHFNEQSQKFLAFCNFDADTFGNNKVQTRIALLQVEVDSSAGNPKQKICEIMLRCPLLPSDDYSLRS
eukprot:TRINITY_DN4485_c0_g2_i1.p1 TRINITY_DN4485_c0_g2~~TRINITY_DN4485_c0_g2_i1.p1  ORF type:complete len:872 (+),score=117.42 TRINITY_DN4485_c0_g2_i1:96-2711(+)